MKEAERELLVVAGRAHRHCEGFTVDADLERLFDGHLVGNSLTGDLLVHPRIDGREVMGGVLPCGPGRWGGLGI